ncbi:MAG: phage tail protein [Thermoanaerobaculia bacterium]|nr:phage tail protein [Thermoanaerobaculia bacterium]
MKKTLLFRTVFLSLGVLLSLDAVAQNVGINDDNSAPDPNAMLDVKSASKGVLFPRLTTAQRNTLGVANPTEGMLVFDTDVEAFFYFTNSAWVQLSTGAGGAVPVGTILPFAGAVTDNGMVVEPVSGYLLCNGAEITSLQYPALKGVLLTAWGDGDDTDLNTVNLPDLRGMFLRGVSGPRGDGKEDPDDTGRTTMLPGGNTGDNVGSYQGDQFSSHNHGGGDHRHGQPFSGYFYYRPGAGGWDVSSNNGEVHASSYTSYSGEIISYQGGAETRPRNANVYYIIKY